MPRLNINFNRRSVGFVEYSARDGRDELTSLPGLEGADTGVALVAQFGRAGSCLVFPVDGETIDLTYPTLHEWSVEEGIDAIEVSNALRWSVDVKRRESDSQFEISFRAYADDRSDSRWDFRLEIMDIEQKLSASVLGFGDEGVLIGRIRAEARSVGDVSMSLDFADLDFGKGQLRISGRDREMIADIDMRFRQRPRRFPYRIDARLRGNFDGEGIEEIRAEAQAQPASAFSWLVLSVMSRLADGEFDGPFSFAIARVAYSFPDRPSTKRIIAYFMHEDEELVAVQAMDPAAPGNEGKAALERTGSFVMGDATDDQIADIRRKGIVVREVDLLPQLEGTEPSITEVFSNIEQQSPQRCLMQLAGPMLDERLRLLQEYGVRLIESLPGDQYRIDVRPTDAENVRLLPFVVALRSERGTSSAALESMMIGSDQVARGPFRAIDSTLESERSSTTFDLWLVEGTDAFGFRERLKALDVVVDGAEGRKVRVQAVAGSPLHRQLIAMPEVEIMEEYIAPDWHNDHARTIMGVTIPGPPPIDLPWDGNGQIVAVADTGIDDTHPDFTGRIVRTFALGRPGLTDDPHGHGTHVSGSALGDGTASGGALKGVAPGAKLLFQSVLGPPNAFSAFPLSGLPLALETLFEQAYLGGARVHNNSWGAFARSYYRVTSREVDEYVLKRKDMLIVISAGNDGATADPPAPARRKSAAGDIDWESIGAPATSKNGITVGASQSDITVGGFAAMTHNAVWPTSFPIVVPAVPGDVATQNISGDAEQLAGFSSRGPGAGLQIKPDVVAPGTDIASARSSSAPSSHYSGPYAGNAKYAHMCGTSMSAPLVSGCAAVVRQYYADPNEKNYSQPSAALVKATLVNGTRQIHGAQATAAPRGFPNSHQGFGRIDMTTTLPTPTNTFDLHFYDNWNNAATHLSIRDRQRFSFALAIDVPWLRVCLSYTDRPGNAVQNVLFLQLQHISTKTKWTGNDGQLADFAALGVLHVPDRYNNTSIIRRTTPLAGDYMIQVSPQNLPFGGTQDFALVVSAPGISHFSVLPFNG